MPLTAKRLGPIGVDTSAGGSLDAMMLDMKRTFDEVVLTHAGQDTAQQILENPVYQAVSSSFAGTQEYMAMEKLGQLRASDVWDLIIVDTPPSRSALDFLDAPNRMSRFLDGTMIRLLTAPARAGGKAGLRIVGAGFSFFSRIISKILGGQLLNVIVKGTQGYVVAALGSLLRQTSGKAFGRPEVRPEEHGQRRVMPMIHDLPWSLLRLSGADRLSFVDRPICATPDLNGEVGRLDGQRHLGVQPIVRVLDQLEPLQEHAQYQHGLL